jgi:LysM domain
MAIAPLPYIGGPETEDLVWPRPTLRLVQPIEEVVEPEVIVPIRPVLPPQGRPLGERRAIRAAQRRRRRIVLATLAAGVVVLALALPIRALGTVTVSGQQTPGGTTAGLADGSPYVVQPGDTLASIANRINPADATQLVRQMANEVGSHTIVPGEHLILP